MPSSRVLATQICRQAWVASIVVGGPVRLRKRCSLTGRGCPRCDKANRLQSANISIAFCDFGRGKCWANFAVLQLLLTRATFFGGCRAVTQRAFGREASGSC
jgi:hypothetical protein